MIGFARRHYPERDHPNLTFQVADATALSYRDEFERLHARRLEQIRGRGRTRRRSRPGLLRRPIRSSLGSEGVVREF